MKCKGRWTSKWNYSAVIEIRGGDEHGQYLTFGIKAKRKTPLGWELIELIHDVSSDRFLVKRIVASLDCYHPSPARCRDVISNMLP